MESWIIYGLILAIIYAVWTILLENTSKKLNNCFCFTLLIYIIAGLIALIYYFIHIKYTCTHGHSIRENLDVLDWKIISIIIIVAALIILSYKTINVSFKKDINMINV